MKLHIFVICSLMLEATRSLKPTRVFSGVSPDSGQFYFEDNITTHPNKNNALRGDYVSQTNAQQQVSNDMYLRAQQQLSQVSQNSNQFKIVNQPPNQNLNQNLNSNQYVNQTQNGIGFQPSSEILPPYYNIQDYYATKQIAQDKGEEVVVNNRSSTNVDPVPLTQRNATEQEIRFASEAISHIGIFMMQNVERNQGNIVMSPLSVVNMLALLQTGATGETQRQISQALNLPPEILRAAFQFMNTEFRKRGARHNVLRLANSMFAANSFKIGDDFRKIASQDFESEVSRISFEDPNLAAQNINSWIASKTNNQIDKLVSPDTIGADTQLMLVNAVYFKGIWETMFKSQLTKPQEFHRSNGEKKTVQFMSLRSGFRCGLDMTVNAMVVVLPFENKQYSLMMLLPVGKANVQNVLANLTGSRLAGYKDIHLQDVLLEIPKFTVRGTTDLAPILSKMRITKIFSGASELKNIGMYRTNAPQVSSAVHSAMISIDERGATAAASTVVAVVALSYDSPSVVFRADRPFLAVLWDDQLNVPLFMTQIEDPTV